MENNCKRLIFACLVVSLALIVGGETLSPNQKPNCTYTVTIQTTCTVGAGTANHVSLRFGDATSNDVLVRRLNTKHVRRIDPLDPSVLDDVPRKPFQACSIDEFHISGRCVESPICYLYLKSNGADEWRPGYVQVRMGEERLLSSEYFYFRRFLPRHVWHGVDQCKTKFTPFGLRRERKI